jgi:hypothetical protein
VLGPGNALLGNLFHSSLHAKLVNAGVGLPMSLVRFELVCYCPSGVGTVCVPAELRTTISQSGHPWENMCTKQCVVGLHVCDLFAANLNMRVPSQDRLLLE